ncbi:MAG: sugar-binding protein, partial [Armatimonadota bacterium]
MRRPDARLTLTLIAALLVGHAALAEPLALVQGLSGIPYNKRMGPERAEMLCRELARHFHVTELGVSYFCWRYPEWKDPGVREMRDEVVAHLRAYVEAAHTHGLQVALSHFAAAYPGCSERELAARPEYRAMALDPATGEAVPSANGPPFDYANPEALDYALRAWRELLELLPPFDYLFYNENCLINPRETTYYRCGFYSDGALADYRRFVGDPTARFPVREGVAEGQRTFRSDDAAVWERYYDWRESVFTRYLQGYARVAAEVFGRTGRYKGAIYFQHKDWVGRDVAIDLEEALDSPHIAWLVCEYARSPEDPQLRLFESAAREHGKRFSTFINVGHYHPLQPGGMRPNSPRGIRRVFEMSVALGADGICAYPGRWVVPGEPEYSPSLTAIWDALCSREGMFGPKQAVVRDATRLIERLTDLPLSGRVARVVRARGPIRVDGQLDDLDQSAPLSVEEAAQVALGSSNWDGPKDVSAIAILNYDDDALYVGARVRDDFLAPLPAEMPWPPENDSVTVGIAVQPPRRPMLHYGEGAYTISVSFREDPLGTVWTTVPWKGPPRQGVEAAFATAGEGAYIVEVRIPWRNAGLR